jgi:hypothetical protein
LLDFISWLWTVHKDKRRLFYLAFVINGIPVLTYSLLSSGDAPILMDMHGTRPLLPRQGAPVSTTARNAHDGSARPCQTLSAADGVAAGERAAAARFRPAWRPALPAWRPALRPAAARVFGVGRGAGGGGLREIVSRRQEAAREARLAPTPAGCCSSVAACRARPAH